MIPCLLCVARISLPEVFVTKSTLVYLSADGSKEDQGMLAISECYCLNQASSNYDRVILPENCQFIDPL